MKINHDEETGAMEIIPENEEERKMTEHLVRASSEGGAWTAKTSKQKVRMNFHLPRFVIYPSDDDDE